MSNAAKLKKKAAEFEQKKQLDKALALYRQILDEADPDDPDVDVGLFNRVGDLLLRQGSVSDAVNYYEKAVDLYAEGGFFNNAIALCNKILRQSPGRNSIYYKLGKISAKKGFKSDAKQNFLEYADRMQKAGQLDEAFRALKEFADLCPDQDDIRLMLAEQLAKRERKTEAMEQLQTLYERFEEEGRSSEARATLDRMKAIDPDAQPKASEGGKKSQKSSDLVFLDVDYDTAPPVRRPAPRATVKLPTPLAEDVIRPVAKGSPVDGLPLIEPLPEPSAPDAPMDPAAFGAMRLGTPMDVPAIADDRHDLALPGDLPMLEVDGTPPEGLDIVVPDADGPALEEPVSLDGLVPPIGRASTEAAPQLDTMGLEIDRSTAGAGADASSLVASSGLDLEPTMLGGDDSIPSVAPLAGFEQTALDDLHNAGIDAGGDLPLLEVPDESHDDLAFIEEIPGAAHIDSDVPRPDAVDRSTRRLTPAELAALDAAARRAVVAPPAPPGPPAIAAEALELADDLDETAPVVHGRPQPSPALVAHDEDDGLTLLEVPDDDHDALELAPEPALDETPEPVAELPLLDTRDVPEAIEEPSFEAPAASDVFAPARPDAGALDAGALELADDVPVGATATGAAGTAARLARRVESEPENWALRREWAEALLEANDRAGGLAQLDAAMVGAERAGDLELARSIADETIRVDRDSVRHHQKRVEYAFRMADRPRLIDAYLELADALFRLGQPDKAQVVYQRVLELAPDDLRASAALTAIKGIVPGAAAPAAAPAPAPRASVTGQGRRYTGEVSRVMTPAENIVPVNPAPRRKEPPPAPAPRVAASAGDDFVNLGDLLRSTEPAKNTRMVVAEQEPTGDEAADFADMLRKFKQGVSQNVDEEDYDSHYDLGVAYKEMGLLDEAIAEFQKALRGPQRRVRTYEALGQCFLEKKQFQVAATILQRAIAEPGQGDEQLVGVLYLLGYAMEALQKPQDALMYYQRVFAVDIQFRDVVDRLNAVEKVAR